MRGGGGGGGLRRGEAGERGGRNGKVTGDDMTRDQRELTRSCLGSPELLSLDNVCSLEEERRLWSLPLSGMTRQ